MRKLFTFLLTMVVAIAANAALVAPTVVVGEEFKSVASLDGKTFAIINKAESKALYGSNNQNLGYADYATAFSSANSGFMWQLESLATNEDETVHGYYLLHLVKPDGTPVPTSDWGGKYLNSQNATGWCCFNLGTTAKKLGQDIDYGAVWDVQYEEGKGFSLKNVGTALYKGADTGTANKEEAAYFMFAPVQTTYVPALKALIEEGAALKAKVVDADAVTAYEAAIAGINPDAVEGDGLTEAKKVDAAITVLAKAFPAAAGACFTRAIINPSFEVGSIDGWTSTDGGNSANNGNFGKATGSYFVERWKGQPAQLSDGTFLQEVSGLPNGTYKLTAEMQNLEQKNDPATNGTGLFLVANEDKTECLEPGTVVVTTTITDGKLSLGAKLSGCTGNWICFDNFQLTLVEPATPYVPEKDAWYTGADFFRFRADKNAAADSPYAAYKDKVEPAWGADPENPTNGCIVCKVPANVNPASQIWIRGTEAGKTVANGSKDGFRVTFRVKADGEYKGLESQAHNNWGYKTGGSPFGTLDVTTEWQTVTFICTGEKAKNDFTDLCFNISGDAERTLYFDDVQIVRGSEWYLNNEFHAKDYSNGDETYSDGANPHPVAPYVAEEGGYVKVVSNANASQTYNSQLWIAIPEKYVGASTKMTMEVKASKAIKCPESFQATATGNGWGCNPGPGSGVEFKVGEWTTVERILKTKDVKSTGTWKGRQADQYCLDLSEKGGEAITYQFRNLKFEDAEEPWTETMAYRLKVTPFTPDPADETKMVKGDDTNEAPAYDFGTGGEEGGYFKVTAAAKQANTYETQFFFQIADAAPTKALKANETVNLKFKIKAISDNLEAGKEIQCGGGFHKSYDGAGWLGGAPASTAKVGEWTTVEQKLEISALGNDKTIPTCYSIDLSQDDKGSITYLIDDVEATWTEAPVLDWVELIPNGDCEKDPEHVFAASKETPVDGANMNQSRYVDSGDATYGKVIEIAAGEKTSEAWDNQFWIYEPYKLPAGTKIIVEFDYKAEKAAKASTQSHRGPGDYIHWAAIGDVNFTTEWQHFKYEGKVADECKDKDEEGNATLPCFRSVAFNLSEFADANKYYIDNVSFKVPAGTIDGIEPIYIDDFKKVEYVDPATLTWTDNLFTNGDVEGEDMSAFIAKVNDDEDALLLPATTKVFKESNQVMVKTAAREKDPADETKYLGNDHDTQFFVRLPYALPKGTKYFFSVDYISNKVADVQSQTHAEPGEYKSNTGVGKITTGSTSQTLEGYFKADNDMRTIAFNLASATEGGTFYFDNFVFKVVKDEEADIKAFTQTWDESSKWNESLALNVAYDKGRNAETEGCTAASVKALDDAMAAGKAILQPAEGAEPATKDAIAAAAKAIEDAIAGLEKGKPELAYTDLTKEMFFHWNAADETAEALEASNCDYNIGTSTGQPYGLSTVNHDRFADLSAYNTIELTATEGEPRLLFNRIENEGTVFAEVPRDKDKYETVVDNGDGSKTYVIDIAAIVAEYGFAHLHAIKGANWANTTVTEIKLGYAGEKPALPIPTAIEGVETAEDALQDGKYFINGQIVIVKNGVKYNAAGVAIK